MGFHRDQAGIIITACTKHESAVRCSASRKKSELRPTKTRLEGAYGWPREWIDGGGIFLRGDW